MPDAAPVEPPERDTVVPLELFFDLVFVFAFTQVAALLSSDPTWGGMLRAGLLLSVLWWAWAAYAWLTNTLDPEEGGVRLVMFAAIAAMLIASLAAPRAFGRDAMIFAVAYFVVRGAVGKVAGVRARNDPVRRGVDADELVDSGRAGVDASEVGRERDTVDTGDIRHGCGDAQRVEVDDDECRVAEPGEVEAPAGRVDALVVEAGRVARNPQIGHSGEWERGDPRAWRRRAGRGPRAGSTTRSTKTAPRLTAQV